MREICAAILCGVVAFTSCANIRDDNEIAADPMQQLEQEFFNNLTALMSESEGRGKNVKKKIKDMLKAPQVPPLSPDPVQAVSSRIPCECKNGICTCCVGGFFFSNKGCMKIKYMPEDFAFELRMLFNDNILYKNTISGKNPRPICISPPRFGQWIEMCAKFHDIYFVGRNMHICLDVTATIGEFDLLDR